MFSRELLEEAKKLGYPIVFDREGLEKADGKILGLFAEIVLADHKTGGLGVGINYGHMIRADLIRKAEMRVGEIAKEVKETGDVKGMIEEYTGIRITDEEAKEIASVINSTNKYALSNKIAEILSRYYGVGFVSHKHTGEPVPLLAYGPGAECLVGFPHHVDTAKIISDLMLFGKVEIPGIYRIPRVKDDLNGDYRTDWKDAMLALNVYLGTDYFLADMNGNEIVDLGNVIVLLSS
ncbi:hypothetical protein [Pyrococcus kukulkanii]|uniref:hypothetical protein n=1 Tax=Pyrococcus kukulkanii TaxID=1609559 RepID=UPI003562E436